MRDQQQPRYLVVGFEDAAGTRYRVQRASDMAVCAYGTPPGIGEVGEVVHIREWDSAAEADAFVTRLTVDVSGNAMDPLVLWVPDIRPPAGIDWGRFEALGNIEVDMSVFD